MATPPTFQAEYEASTWGNNTSPKTVTPTTAAGDILAVAAMGADSDDTFGTPTGNSLTYTLAQSIAALSGFTTCFGWTAPDAVGGAGWTLSLSETGAGADDWGFTALRFSGSDGVGASAKDNATGDPTLGITTTQDNSAIVVAIGDWHAEDGASRTWDTVNGITPTAGNGFERVYVLTAGAYTVYVAYYPDAGSAGAKTVGLSGTNSQAYSIIAIEIKGAASGEPAPPPVGSSHRRTPGRRGPSNPLRARRPQSTEIPAEAPAESLEIPTIISQYTGFF